MSDGKDRLPTVDIPQAASDLIDEYMRINKLRSRSEAVRRLLAESVSLKAIARVEDLRDVFGLRTWGGARQRKP